MDKHFQEVPKENIFCCWWWWWEVSFLKYLKKFPSLPSPPSNHWSSSERLSLFPCRYFINFVSPSSLFFFFFFFFYGRSMTIFFFFFIFFYGRSMTIFFFFERDKVLNFFLIPLTDKVLLIFEKGFFFF